MCVVTRGFCWGRQSTTSCWLVIKLNFRTGNSFRRRRDSSSGFFLSSAGSTAYVGRGEKQFMECGRGQLHLHLAPSAEPLPHPAQRPTPQHGCSYLSFSDSPQSGWEQLAFFNRHLVMREHPWVCSTVFITLWACSAVVGCPSTSLTSLQEHLWTMARRSTLTLCPPVGTKHSRSF